MRPQRNKNNNHSNRSRPRAYPEKLGSAKGYPLRNSINRSKKGLSNDQSRKHTYKRVYKYKLTTNRDYWQGKLKNVRKRLSKKDISYLRSVRNEYLNNCALRRIHE